MNKVALSGAPPTEQQRRAAIDAARRREAREQEEREFRAAIKKIAAGEVSVRLDPAEIAAAVDSGGMIPFPEAVTSED